MADMTRFGIIKRLLEVESYTAEQLGAVGFRCADERSSRPVVLVGLDTVAAIIEYLAEDNQRDRQANEILVELERQIQETKEKLEASIEASVPPKDYK